MRVIYHPAARAEHLQQVAYYEAQAPGLGARYQRAVQAAVERISEGPHRHPVVADPEVRRFSVARFPFAVFYSHTQSEIEILAVAPHRKAPGYWRGRI